jgi:putative NIF3 family GTP cyclohydrolase 1 type 2
MNLILAGHYATELPAVKVLLDCIWKEFNIETELIKDEISAEL